MTYDLIFNPCAPCGNCGAPNAPSTNGTAQCVACMMARKTPRDDKRPCGVDTCKRKAALTHTDSDNVAWSFCAEHLMHLHPVLCLQPAKAAPEHPKNCQGCTLASHATGQPTPCQPCARRANIDMAADVRTLLEKIDSLEAKLASFIDRAFPG